MDGDNNNCPRSHLDKTIVEKHSSLSTKKKLKQKSCFRSGKFQLIKIDMHLMGQFELIFV